jgi:hypothetical protein
MRRILTISGLLLPLACAGDGVPTDTDLGTTSGMTATETMSATGDGDTTTGDGDGSTGDGDGDGSSGDGDGSSGDGDGSAGDGDGSAGDGDGSSGDGDGSSGDGDGSSGDGDGSSGDGDGTSGDGDGDGTGCGNGIIETGEDCDDGALNNDLSGPCRTDCTMCECQGTNPTGTECSALGFSCGVLACDGCYYDTSACETVPVPTYTGPAAPDFGEHACWFPCQGFTDTTAAGEVPAAWGAGCDQTAFTKIRLVCGIDETVYRYIDIDKNIFLFSLAANPEAGLVSATGDQNETPFTLAVDGIWAEGTPPFVPTDTSWFGGQVDCVESSASLTVNNELCGREVANCFGQNIAVDRKLWVYAKP